MFLPVFSEEIGGVATYVFQVLQHVEEVLGLFVLISTLLDRLAKKFQWVRVSVDAGTEATFKEYRPAPNGKSLFLLGLWKSLAIKAMKPDAHEGGDHP